MPSRNLFNIDSLKAFLVNLASLSLISKRHLSSAPLCQPVSCLTFSAFCPIKVLLNASSCIPLSAVTALFPAKVYKGLVPFVSFPLRTGSLGNRFSV